MTLVLCVTLCVCVQRLRHVYIRLCVDAGPFNLNPTMMRHVLAVIVPLVLVAGQVASDNKEEEEGFDFDHAFRKFQSYLEKHQEQPDRLTERMGVALGAGDEAEEEEAEIELMPEHEFLRDQEKNSVILSKLGFGAEPGAAIDIIS